MVNSTDVLFVLGTCCIIFFIIIALLYYFIIEVPKEKQKYADQKLYLDSLSCSQLGDWVVNNSLNSTYSDDGYKNPNYPYAQAKFIQCTHSGSLGEK